VQNTFSGAAPDGIPQAVVIMSRHHQDRFWRGDEFSDGVLNLDCWLYFFEAPAPAGNLGNDRVVQPLKDASMQPR